jgi:hypothetical protein
MTGETPVGASYVDKAHIWLMGDLVQRFDVIEVQQ